MPPEHWDCRFNIPHDGPCEPRNHNDALRKSNDDLANTIYVAFARPELTWWDDLPNHIQDDYRRAAQAALKAVLDDIERRLPDVSNRPHEVQQERGRVLRIIEDIRRGLRSS